ncbi:MAG: hypothetical protein HQL40_10190 [Alphaproteobacteria bacterium]|nr:hypothetical protein [Alphaproteobacteria bacterium]
MNDTQIAEVTSAIIGRLRSGSKNEEWIRGGRGERTQVITRVLTELGQDFGYTVASAGSWAWLFDVVWLDYEVFDRERLLRRLVLVAESELSTGILAIRVDFNKLLVARASLSLMIFQTDRPYRDTQYNISYYVDLFQQSLDTIQPAFDGRLLCAGYDNQREEFEFYELRDGQLVSVYDDFLPA